MGRDSYNQAFHAFRELSLPLWGDLEGQIWGDLEGQIIFAYICINTS
jgi:hypothetical protein